MAGRGLAPDVKEAQALVMAGLVFSGTERLEKPGALLPEDSVLSVRVKEHGFVSRGGVKLQGALDYWKLNLRGLRCVDFGASTGGFTDCLLKAGVGFVYAVDSGTNQLDWKLRQHPKVKSMERTNARELKAADLEGEVDFGCLDLSFIGLAKVFPALQRVLKAGAFWVALVKPQFEAAPSEVPEGGVITDADLRARICDHVVESARGAGLGPIEVRESSLPGKDGNVEFLLLGQKI